MGIPMLKPFLCFGSPPYLHNYFQHHKFYEAKHKQFGLTFGKYDGVQPILVTIDPEIIKEICTKQFDNFTDVLDIEFAPDQTTLDVSR